jgi:hypothetical protein
MTFGEFAQHTLDGYYNGQQLPAGASNNAAGGASSSGGGGGTSGEHAAGGDADADCRGRWDQRLASPPKGPAQRDPGGATAAGAGAAAVKDVAPAAVHMAVAATGRQLAQLMVSHE